MTKLTESFKLVAGLTANKLIHQLKKRVIWFQLFTTYGSFSGQQIYSLVVENQKAN